MNIHQEQQQSYTGYAETSQEPQYDYPHLEQQFTYTTTSGQPYGQPPVQVFVQFTQSQQHAPRPFDGSRIAAALSYSFGWLSGLLFFLFSDDNRYVRFHALQSLLFFGGINVFDILFIWNFVHFRLFEFVPFMPYLGGLAILSFLLLNFVAFVGWFVALFQAARGTYFKLPVVGEIVARLLQLGPPDMVK
jgi:uncharacterized membrane protein